MGKKRKKKGQIKQILTNNLIRVGKDFATLNIWKQRVYDEKMIRIKGKEYRIWNPKKSKIAAALKKGLKILPVKKGDKILYLGIASGTTASHLSDIIEGEGMIYGVEFSSRVFRDLMIICKERKNISPILGDARKPEEYSFLVPTVDILFCDIAQPDQVEIFERNAKWFLKKSGYAMIAIKARSIDVSKRPEVVFKEAEEKLKKNFEIVQKLRLDPFEKDHAFFLCKYV